MLALVGWCKSVAKLKAVAVDGLGNVVFSDEPTNRILRAQPSIPERLQDVAFSSRFLHLRACFVGS